MRVNVHDYSGHPFQVQLSRELAARGHDVLHEYSSQYVSGHGRLTVEPGDAPTLAIEAVTADRAFERYEAVGRSRFELSYAKAWQRKLEAGGRFDLIVVCNVPLFALTSMARYFASRNQPWVFWHQDIYSMGVGAEIDRKLPRPAAKPLRRWVEALERAQVRQANRVVAIDEAFVDQYRTWGLTTDHVSVQPNWAPVNDLVPGARDNSWSAEQGLATDRVRFLYSGTLGRKHNPLLLLDLLDAAIERGVDAELVVCSEGCGADDLAEAAAGRADVHILGYQPADRFAEVLASADVMVALLEPDAAAFSVPSKVLSYLSAGRPTIALLPAGNAAAHDVRTAGGFVGTPDRQGAVAAAAWLADTVRDELALARIGHAARALAEQLFDIETIADRFERVLHEAAGVPRPVRLPERLTFPAEVLPTTLPSVTSAGIDEELVS